jgi:hypothetical protein
MTETKKSRCARRFARMPKPEVPRPISAFANNDTSSGAVQSSGPTAKATSKISGVVAPCSEQKAQPSQSLSLQSDGSHTPLAPPSPA